MTGEGSRTGRSEPGILGPLVFVVAAAWLGVRTLARLISTWPFTTDDAYITLRYARHLAAGQGLVWNVGEAPVEGYSNFAFVLLGAGLSLVGELEPGPVKILACASLAATGYLQWAIARRFVRPLPALLPFALYTLHRGVYWWTVSGLETSVHVAIGCAVVLACLRGLGFARVELGADEAVGLRRGQLRPRALALAGGLCMLDALVRPEGPLLAVAVGLGAGAQVFVDRRTAARGSGSFDAAGYRRAALSFLVAFVPAMLAYAAWRYATFGELVPNTVRCKTGHADRFALIEDYWTAARLSLLLAVIWPLRSLDARMLLPVGVLGVYAAALLGADPLIGHDLRHLLVAHALICVLASASAVRIACWMVDGIGPRVIEIGLVALVLATATSLGDLPEREDLHHRATEYGARTRARAALGRHLARELRPGEQALVGDVGMVGFAGDAAIIDAFCLNSSELARPPLRGDPEAAATWVLDDRRPQVIVVHTRSKSKIQPRGAIYRRLVERDRFREGWRAGRRFNSEHGRFHYVVHDRIDEGE